jgi:hypothetical protein
MSVSKLIILKFIALCIDPVQMLEITSVALISDHNL